MPASPAKRNEQRYLYGRYLILGSLRKVADETGVSHTAVANAVKYSQLHPQDETERALHAALIDGLVGELNELFHKFSKDGPSPQFNVKGEINRDSDGDTVYDTEKFAKSLTDLAKTQDVLLKSKREMLATDIPKKLPMLANEARAEMDDFFAELEPQVREARELKQAREDLEQAMAKARAMGIMIDGAADVPPD
jgi:hypothetical protein